MARKKDWNQVVQEASDNYQTLIDSPDANTTYVGQALHGTVSSSSSWQLMKISTSGNVNLIQYANGDDDYKYIWDSRAGYVYS